MIRHIFFSFSPFHRFFLRASLVFIPFAGKQKKKIRWPSLQFPYWTSANERRGSRHFAADSTGWLVVWEEKTETSYSWDLFICSLTTSPPQLFCTLRFSFVSFSFFFFKKRNRHGPFFFRLNYLFSSFTSYAWFFVFFFVLFLIDH